MIAASRLVVADAGPLIHLDELDCLDLLSDFAQVLVTDVVWAEVSRHRPGALATTGISLRRVESSEYQILPSLQIVAQAFELDPGEITALAVMQSERTAILLTDDSAARLAAESFGFAVHGTIGVLLRAIHRKQRTGVEILNILRSMPERSTLHIALKLLVALIFEVETYVGNTSAASTG